MEILKKIMGKDVKIQQSQVKDLSTTITNINNTINSKTSQVELYSGPDRATALTTWREITLSDNISNYRMIIYIIGTSGLEVTSMCVSALYPAGSWRIYVLGGYNANGEVELVTANKIRWRIREISGWSPVSIGVIKIYGIK